MTLSALLIGRALFYVLVIPTSVRHGDVVTTEGYRNLQIENTHPGCTNPPADKGRVFSAEA